MWLRLNKIFLDLQLCNRDPWVSLLIYLSGLSFFLVCHFIWQWKVSQVPLWPQSDSSRNPIIIKWGNRTPVTQQGCATLTASVPSALQHHESRRVHLAVGVSALRLDGSADTCGFILVLWLAAWPLLPHLVGWSCGRTMSPGSSGWRVAARSPAATCTSSSQLLSLSLSLSTPRTLFKWREMVIMVINVSK